jgi:hypothetical protein
MVPDVKKAREDLPTTQGLSKSVVDSKPWHERKGNAEV